MHCAAFGLSDADIIYPYDTYGLCKSWNWSFPLRLFFAGAIHFVQSVSLFQICIYRFLFGFDLRYDHLSAATTTRMTAYMKALSVGRGQLGDELQQRVYTGQEVNSVLLPACYMFVYVK